MRSRFSVFWVRADSLANFLDDFSQIMDQLEPSNIHLSPFQDRPLLARNVTTRLEKDSSSWLLILDNADNYDLFVRTTGVGNAISNYVPKQGRVLITTRDPRFQGSVTAAKDGLHVKPMDTSEARDLFMRSIPLHLASQSSPAMVNELLDLLGNLPLALAQAAANIADQQRPVQDYIASYREKRNRPLLMKEPALDLETQDTRTSRQSILATYEISFEDLERDHQLSARCLNYFGFFHWQKIPESCIRALPGLKELDDESFRNTVKHLLHLSMIEETPSRDGSEYSVHPVIHERISNRLSGEEKRSCLSDSITVMLSKYPMIQSNTAREDSVSCRYLQSHALIQVKLATEIDLKSGQLSYLYSRCANFLRLSGMTFDSVHLATQAVAMGQAVWGFHSGRTIVACVERIACLIGDAQYQEGYNASKSAMKNLESAKLDNEVMDDSDYLALRGLILAAMSQACQGLRKYEEAEEIRKDLLSNGPSDDIGISLNDRYGFALALFMHGKLQEAQKMNNELLTSMDEQQRTAYRGNFLVAYRLKANILVGMRQGSDTEPAVVLEDGEERAMLQIFRDVSFEYLATFPITDVGVWTTCNDLLNELSLKGKTLEAAKILESMLAQAVESRLRLEGGTLLAFGKSLHIGLRVIFSLRGTGDSRQKPPGLTIAQLFAQLIELAGTPSRRLWRSYFLLYHSSMIFLLLGESSKAEELLREALQKISLEEDRSNEGLIHWPLMLAIARQGHTDDARRYKDTHLALIAPEESTYGDLDWVLQLDKEEKELYDKAKGIITARERKVPESWWTKHRTALNRAQFRYGLLVPESAEEDRGPYEDVSDITETDKKQKRKSRGLGGLIGRFHKSSLSSPHA